MKHMEFFFQNNMEDKGVYRQNKSKLCGEARDSSHSLACGYLVVLTKLVETLFFPLNYFNTLVEN